MDSPNPTTGAGRPSIAEWSGGGSIGALKVSGASGAFSVSKSAVDLSGATAAPIVAIDEKVEAWPTEPVFFLPSLIGADGPNGGGGHVDGGTELGTELRFSAVAASVSGPATASMEKQRRLSASPSSSRVDRSCSSRVDRSWVSIFSRADSLE